jgi:hypothetical protein
MSALSDMRGKSHRQCQRALACLRLATLIASQLLFACHWVFAQPAKKTHTASIVREIDVDNASPAGWCGDTFVLSKGYAIFRYDTS